MKIHTRLILFLHRDLHISKVKLLGSKMATTIKGDGGGGGGGENTASIRLVYSILTSAFKHFHYSYMERTTVRKVIRIWDA